MAELFLIPERDHAARRWHPWVFSGGVARVTGDPTAGQTVLVRSADGSPLGWGAWSPSSQIALRFWTFDPEQEVDADFIEARLAHAIAARGPLLAADASDSLRLVNAEADGLPGLIVDRYGQFLVCQFATAGAERWKQQIVAALEKLTPSSGIYERSDSEMRTFEGLEPSCGRLAGSEPPERLTIREHNCHFLVDLRKGQRTGFYLDQRDNRALVAPYTTSLDMLNVFSYTGGFGVLGHKAGAASVVHVDQSQEALALARENCRLNVCDVNDDDFIHGNAFEVLRSFRDARRSFDVIVVDPPKFVDSRKHLMAACRGYKDINLLAIKLLRPGGVLATFSCSSLVTPDILRKVVSDAAIDAGRNMQIVSHLNQAADHPVGLFFPEGLYLKGLLCRLLN